MQLQSAVMAYFFFISHYSIKNSPEQKITAVSLPDNEKPSSVALCDYSVIVLSSKGRVFKSDVENGSSVLRFSAVEELTSEKIVCISGLLSHFFSVNEKGNVFGLESNGCGELGFDKKIKSVSSFKNISSLEGYNIRASYAGFSHSLFETNEGKILSCGHNKFAQLLLSREERENVYFPLKTIITNILFYFLNCKKYL